MQTDMPDRVVAAGGRDTSLTAGGRRAPSRGRNESAVMDARPVWSAAHAVAVALAAFVVPAFVDDTARAQVSLVAPASPDKPTISANPPQSPRLQIQPQVNALSEALHNPTSQEASTAIHTGPWGVFNRDGGSPAGFGPVARYGVDFSAENWSYLGNPALSHDIFDALKFIPLSPDKSIYLTLSGEERLKNWYETRPFLGTQQPNDSGRMTVRGLYGADLHLGPYVRIFGELVNGDAGGWDSYGYNSNYRTRLDLEQLFGEVTLPLAGARTGFRVGRQQFLDAPNYVLFARETPDVPLSWNGVRAYAFWPRLRIDLFDFVETNNNPPQLFRDNENWNARLFGAYESWAPPDFHVLGRPGHVFLDFFYLGYEYGGTAAAIPTATGTASGSTLRNNYGMRFWGKAGPIEFSLGGIYQGGEFRYAKDAGTRPVEAYAINTVVGWRFNGLYTHPLVALQTDLYSGGDDSRKTGSVGTYAAPYNPSTNYLDTTTYLAPSNLIDTGPVLQMTTSRDTLLRIKVPVFWRDSTNDAVYGSSRIYSFRGKYDGGFVGVTPQISLAWRITRHLSWTNDVARFFASSALKHAGASDGTYYLSTLDFRF